MLNNQRCSGFVNRKLRLFYFDDELARKPVAAFDDHLAQRAAGEDMQEDAVFREAGADVGVGVGVDFQAGAVAREQRGLVYVELDRAENGR